jgi:asparagine synthetase B (glutamine-hydrolysing)
MCGIGGVVRWGQLPITEEHIRVLLIGNEHRGNDASGIAIQQVDGKIDICKKDRPGWQFVTDYEYEKFIKDKLREDSRCVLVHARGASQGNPRDNNNNHPMYAGLSAVVHNGVIRNDAWLFDSQKLERKAATDSDILRAIVDKHGITKEAIWAMDKASGSGAIAAIHPDFRDKLLIVRSGNPLTLASNDNFLFFSSEKNTLHKACRPFVKRKGMWFQAQRPNVDFTNMPQDTAWIIGLDGLETHVSCRICMGAYSEPWRKTYEEYAKRQKKWDDLNTTKSEEMKPAWCYKCQKEWLIPKDAVVYGDYTCNTELKGCGSSLCMPPRTPLVDWAGKRIN